jgi:flagellin FlaB
MPRRSKRRRGITGIEAAIVMIAFVIVAAALAFVTLNMGMFTTQRAKEVINRGLGEASSALEVDGSATGLTDSNNLVVNISVPIKLAPGRDSVDLRSDKLAIYLKTPSGAYENVHSGVYILKKDATGWILSAAESSLTDITVSNDTSTYPDLKTIANKIGASGPAAYVIFIKTVNEDTVMEFGEKAVIMVFLGSGLTSYQEIKLEVRPPEGAPLTVVRSMPAILPQDQAVDLG